MSTPWANSVQQGSVTIANNATSNSTSLSTAVGALAFIMFQGQTASDTSGTAMNHFASIALSGSNVFATRGGNTGTLTVNFSVIDATSQFVASVQSGTIATSNGAGTATITAIDTTRSAVFLTGQQVTGTGTNCGNWVNVLALENATTVTAAAGGGNCIVGFQVVEFATGIVNSIQPVSNQNSGTGTQSSASITSAVGTNTMLAWGGNTGQSSLPYQSVMLYQELGSASHGNVNSIISNRQVGHLGNTTTNATAVEFIPGVLISQSGTLAIPTGTSATYIVGVDPTTTFVNYTGESNGLGTYVGNEGHASISLSSGDTLTALVNAAGGTPIIAYQTITLDAGGGGGTAPVLPPGWPATYAFCYYNWWDNSGPGNFVQECQDPNFPIAFAGITTDLEPDPLYANVLPAQLQAIFDNVPVPPGKHYYLAMHIPLSSLSLPATSYPFATRLMSVLDPDRTNPVQMLVPIQSPANYPLITPYVNTCIENLIGLIAEYGNGNFTLIAVGLESSSSGYFDAQYTVPSDAGNGTNIPPETPQQAITNWGSYGVTMGTLPSLTATHFQTIAAGAGAGLFLLCPVLNPGLGIIGQGSHGGGTGEDYQLFTTAISNAMFDIGQVFPVSDQSLGKKGTERTDIAAAANYSTCFVCQITGGTGGPVFQSQVEYAQERCAIWFEIGNSDKNPQYGTQLDQLSALGWNGTEFIPPTIGANVIVTS